MRKLKFTPIYFVFYGLIFYLLCFFIGPYDWEIKNWDAILVLIAGIICMIFGMSCCKSFLNRYKVRLFKDHFGKSHKTKHYELSKIGEYVLLFLDLVAIIASAIYFRDLTTYVSFSSVAELQDTRHLLADNLSFIQKVVSYVCLLGIPVYIITAYEERVKIPLLRWLRTPCFWLPAISFMLTSARWNFVFSLVIFLIINFENKENRFLKIIKLKKNSGFFLSFLVIAVLLYTMLTLFTSRGSDTGITTYLSYYGAIEIKDVYQSISTLGKGFYQFFFYLTHSVPYYSAIYDYLTFEHTQYGTLAFSHLRFFIPIFNNWNQFVNYNPTLTGNYTPTITGFFVDWGFAGAFVAMFITGWIFQWICEKEKDSALMKYLKPIVLFQCLMLLQGYVWFVASAHFIGFLIICVVFLLTIMDKIMFSFRRAKFKRIE